MILSPTRDLLLHLIGLSTGVAVVNRWYRTIGCFLLLVFPCDLCIIAEKHDWSNYSDTQTLSCLGDPYGIKPVKPAVSKSNPSIHHPNHNLNNISELVRITHHHIHLRPTCLFWFLQVLLTACQALTGVMTSV